MRYVNEWQRSILSEGRDKGMGHAFCMFKDGVATAVMPMSPCKDYLNDVIYSERTGKPFSAHGLDTTKRGLFEGAKAGYLATAICKETAGLEEEYDGWEDEVKQLNTNQKAMTTGMNWIEEKLKIRGRTTMHAIEPNLVIVELPLFWCAYPYLISFYGLILRNLLTYKRGSVVNFLKKAEGEDVGYLPTTLKKFAYMQKHGAPVQDMTDEYFGPHDQGIVSFKFPNE